MTELKQRNKKMLMMREKGHTYPVIAAHFGVCTQTAQTTVRRLLKERTLSERWPFWSLLSYRTRNVLGKKYGEQIFANPKVLLHHTRHQVSKLQNIGKYSMREIDIALIKLGIISKEQKW